MKPIKIRPLTTEELTQLNELYRQTKDVRVRNRAQMILLGAEDEMTAPQILDAHPDAHPMETIYVAWDNVNTHQDDEVDAVVRSAADRLVLMYLPTYSPRLNPIEMLWHHVRREVTHCKLIETVKALLIAAQDFFDRHNRVPEHVLSIIGAKNPHNLFEYT